MVDGRDRGRRLLLLGLMMSRDFPYMTAIVGLEREGERERERERGKPHS